MRFLGDGMQQVYQLKKEATEIRLLQLTDMHLFSDPQAKLLGVNTQASFQAVLDEVMAEPQPHFDAVLATGDLIQDSQVEGYDYFAQMVQPLASPVFWLEGNHDEQPQMHIKLAPYPYICAEKQILAGKHWQILLLNSQVSGCPRGYLSKEQLIWLEAKLAEYPERFCLIALHHNLLPTHCAWLDQHCLQNREHFAEVLAPFKQIKAILHGHIHQTVDSSWHGIRVLATPSTCIQFKPNCDEFTLDLLAPGWRELVLKADGQIETVVKRLKTQTFLPNLGAKGY